MAAPSSAGAASGSPGRRRSERWAPLLLLFGLAGALLVPLLGRQGLSDPGESSLAQSAREMRERGDWLVPTLYGEPAAERPPVMCWVVAGSFALFGESEMAARIPSVLAALALLAVVWRLALRLGAGRLGGWTAAVILASSLQFVLIGRSADPDVPFTLCFTAGIVCLLEALRRPARGAWGPAGAALLGVSVLFLGTAGFVLVAAVAVPCVLLVARGRVTSLRPLLSCATFLAVVLPWYVTVAARDPSLASRWLAPGRVLDAARYGAGAAPASPFAFGSMLLVGFLPWSLFLPGALARSAARFPQGLPDARLRVVPAIWLLAMLALFTLAAGRFSSSILPALPAAAILAAEPISSWLEQGAGERRLKGMGALLLLVILMGGMVFFSTSRDNFGAIPFSFKAALLPICFAGLLGSLFTLSSLLLRRPRLAFLLLAGGCAILDFTLLAYGFPTLEPWRSSRPAAYAVKPMIGPGDRVVVYRRFPPGFAYYLDRIPERVSGEEALQRILALPQRAFCLMERDLFEQMRTRRPFPPLFLLSRSGGVVVVSNRSPAADAAR
ncbi:MAG TPA: glycosyltransferase family 39 protein [Candidatus Polarisedimenticolia bacterium]|nr:glycosyltransferase family 39 protein [Candidatus Polarisedimenticolia bacterium]